MKHARTKAIAAKKGIFERFKALHERLPFKSRIFCAKSPVFWILAFYIIKGTAVTLAAAFAALFLLF